MTSNSQLDATTRAQIDALDLTPQPLIICDMDEVLLNFVIALEGHLDRNGFWLDKQSFALNGNIKYNGGHDPADTDQVRELIYTFFANETANMTLVPGAREALTTLADHAEIVFLTNMPDIYRDARLENLNGHGIYHPVVTNSGPKGPAAIEIARKAGEPVFFLDDTPGNIKSVKAALPEAHVIHFIADPDFASLVEKIDGISLRSSDWQETHKHIHSILDGSKG